MPQLIPIYVSRMKSYEVLNENEKPMLFKLNKSLYGLKQSDKNWNNLLCSYLWVVLVKKAQARI